MEYVTIILKIKFLFNETIICPAICLKKEENVPCCRCLKEDEDLPHYVRLMRKEDVAQATKSELRLNVSLNEVSEIR